MVAGTFPAPNVQGHPEPACHVLDEFFVRVRIFPPKGVVEVHRFYAKGRLEDLCSLLKG